MADIDDILEGWELKALPDGVVIVTHKDGSVVVARNNENESIASCILYRLVTDIIERS